MFIHHKNGTIMVEVMEMKQENFHDHRSYLCNIYTERNKDEERAPLGLYESSFYKKSAVSFTVHAPAPLYSKYPLPIKAAKATDLQRLSMYVPHTLRCRYIGLPTV